MLQWCAGTELGHLLMQAWSMLQWYAGTELGIHIQAIDERPPSNAELTKPIWFGHVAIGAQQQHVMRLHNSTALPMPFCWQQTDEPVMQGLCKRLEGWCQQQTDGSHADNVTLVLVKGDSHHAQSTPSNAMHILNSLPVMQRFLRC